MVEEKVQLLTEYIEITKSAIEQIHSDQIGELLETIDMRDNIIEQINILDDDNGSVIMNPAIQGLINTLRPLDQLMLTKMEEKKEELRSKMNSIQKGKQLKNQYNQRFEHSDGIFYDKRQ